MQGGTGPPDLQDTRGVPRSGNGTGPLGTPRLSPGKQAPGGPPPGSHGRQLLRQAPSLALVAGPTEAAAGAAGSLCVGRAPGTEGARSAGDSRLEPGLAGSQLSSAGLSAGATWLIVPLVALRTHVIYLW